MYKASTGFRRLGVFLGSVVSVGWLIFIIVTGHIHSSDWIPIIIFAIVIFFLTYLLVVGVDWVISGFRKKSKPESFLDKTINAIYGERLPARSANLEDAIRIAFKELLFEEVTEEDVRKTAKELYLSPIPYSTHDLSVSVALKFFKQPERKERLSDAQLLARMALLPWIKENKVAVPLAQAFEETLYKIYKS